MTPFEKAKDLIDKFARMDGYDDSIDLSKCEFEKQCALIVVNQILDLSMAYFDDNSDYVNYWQQVKQEIEKL
jgi:hypothetical protein